MFWNFYKPSKILKLLSTLVVLIIYYYHTTMYPNLRNYEAQLMQNRNPWIGFPRVAPQGGPHTGLIYLLRGPCEHDLISRVFVLRIIARSPDSSAIYAHTPIRVFTLARYFVIFSAIPKLGVTTRVRSSK